MPKQAIALAIAIASLAAPAASAQERADAAPTAEEMIEVARELYRPPGLLRRCPVAAPGEIVVCAPDPDELRVPSPTERAYAAGERPPDPIPAAPYVLGLPECGVEVVCHRMGRTPPPIYIIDLEAIPEPLTPEEARQIRRAEDPASPAEASPAELP